MSSATAPVFKPLSRTGSHLHSLLPLETLYSYIYIPRKPVKLGPPRRVTAQRPQPWSRRNRELNSNGESKKLMPGFQTGKVKGDEEPAVMELREEAKLFVGNLPYDVNSDKLAMLFEQAGVVEIARVIYNRDTDQSRGFGFLTMSTVEEAEKAVETFNHYDLDGSLLRQMANALSALSLSTYVSSNFCQVMCCRIMAPSIPVIESFQNQVDLIPSLRGHMTRCWRS